MHIRHAIREVQVAGSTSRGWYDSHELIGWLNANHNQELNEMFALFGGDPVQNGDIAIGKFLYKLGQIKIGEHVSERRVTTPTGNRDGRCVNSIWEISQTTWVALFPGVPQAPLDDLEI